MTASFIKDQCACSGKARLATTLSFCLPVYWVFDSLSTSKGGIYPCIF